MSEIHQQNNETQQTPVLTLDPSSVAKEKVQLEETTQQLEAMAQAAPSATAAAQAASEAVKQMDTTMLTEEDKKSIEEFVKKIDVNNSDHVLLYGADAQKKIADFSDSALATIRTKDTGEVGDMLVNLVNEIKGFSAAAEKPSGIKGLFWNAQKAVSDMQTKYDKVDANVDTIASQLENHQVQLLKDVSMFNHLYDMNTQYFKELTMYIIAGEQKLKEVREGELEELKKKAAETGDAMDAQRANDLAANCDRFEKKLHDLKLTRQVALQMAPQIRLLQNNDSLLVERIQSTLSNTLPLWKSQIVIALGMHRSQEALKAQTVAARTYVLRKRSPDADYDVVDTTNDQVFRGYISGYGNAEKAVEETYGVCGFYKGKLAQCYYAASNGGQTELVESVWPGGGDYGYYAVADDPYDVENPYSVVKSVTLQKSYTNEEHDIAPYGLRNLLATVLRDELTALGFDPAPASIRVNTVSDARLSGEGKRMDTLYLTVQISGRTRQDAAVPAVDSDQEEVSLVLDGSAETAAPTPGSSPSPEVSAVPSATPSATPAPVYGPFTAIEQPFQLEIAIFPTAEKLLAMSISSNYENELWTLVETDTAYRLEARRFGHGVGMSQYGANELARQGKPWREILQWYYTGVTIGLYNG